MSIPYPNISKNITTFPEFMRKVNDASMGEMGFPDAMGITILIVVTIVAFISFKSSLRDTPVEKILPPTFTISFASSVFLAGLGLIPSYIPVAPMIVLLVSIGMLFYKEKTV